MGQADEVQRNLERKALANVRALVDRVEADDRQRKSLKELAKAIPIMLVTVAIFAAGVVFLRPPPKEPPRPPKDMAEYRQQIFSRMEIKANGKDRTELRGLNGQVEVLFTVKPNGYIDTLQVTRPVADARLNDRAAVRILATLQFSSDADNRGTLSIKR